MKRIEIGVALGTLLLMGTPALGQQQHGHHGAHAEHGAATPDTAALGAVADALTEAIVAGDRAAVEALLLEDARIYEGGKVESRTEYFSHHFGSDGAFLGAMQREPLTRSVEIDGHTARVTSTSRLHGTFRERAMDLVSTEVLVLRHSAENGWRVAEVHWSSEPRS